MGIIMIQGIAISVLLLFTSTLATELYFLMDRKKPLKNIALLIAISITIASGIFIIINWCDVSTTSSTIKNTITVLNS